MDFDALQGLDEVLLFRVARMLTALPNGHQIEIGVAEDDSVCIEGTFVTGSAWVDVEPGRVRTLITKTDKSEREERVFTSDAEAEQYLRDNVK